jgi:hypothetical protein
MRDRVRLVEDSSWSLISGGVGTIKDELDRAKDTSGNGGGTIPMKVTGSSAQACMEVVSASFE